MIIDTTENVTRIIPEFEKLGVSGVIRYINPLGQTSKCITLGEAQALGRANVPLALVSEGWGDFAHAGISAAAGQRDGQHALSSLLALGAGNASAPCVFFAIDTDATTALINGLVIPYFKAIRAIFSASKLKPRVGVYGSGAVCATLKGSGIVDLTWLAQSTGWLSSKEYATGSGWALKQAMPSTLAGLSVDQDEARGEDWGQFVPFAASTGVVGTDAVGTDVVKPTPSANTPSAPSVPAASNVVPLPTPSVPARPLAERRLEAATSAISGMMMNGIHNIIKDFPQWLQVIIPSGAVATIAPVLAKAALDAADDVENSSNKEST